MGRIKDVWKTANEIKSAWEWALILAALIGVPVAPIVVGIINGQSADVILLYVVAAVAFGLVFVNDGLPALEELLGRRHRRAVAALIRLREEGVTLRNRSLNTWDEWTSFHADFEAWDEAVIREMENAKVRASDIARFKTLDLFLAPRFPFAFSELHTEDLGQLSEKLNRLMEIILHFEK